MSSLELLQAGVFSELPLPPPCPSGPAFPREGSPGGLAHEGELREEGAALLLRAAEVQAVVVQAEPLSRSLREERMKAPRCPGS